MKRNRPTLVCFGCPNVRIRKHPLYIIIYIIYIYCIFFAADKNLQELILFLTDGIATFPESEITGLLAEHSSRIKCFTCVALGDEADTCILKQIGSKFQEQSINFKLRGANDQETLVTAFKEAASSRAIHCR